MLDRILHLVKRKFLNHALDTLLFGKINRFLAIERVTAGPAMNGSTLRNQSRGVNGNIADSCDPLACNAWVGTRGPTSEYQQLS
jgi:hypothetical protein